jgi:hypothetical protein
VVQGFEALYNSRNVAQKIVNWWPIVPSANFIGATMVDGTRRGIGVCNATRVHQWTG